MLFRSPSDIKREIGRLYWQFSGYDQQDSFEFILYFIETLNEELNRVKYKPPYSELKQDSDDYNKLVYFHNFIER